MSIAVRLSFPESGVIGELEWPGGAAAATGVVEVPDGVALTLYVSADEPVSLDFLRRLPADAITELHLQYPLVAESFVAVTHLTPGLRCLHLVATDLGDEALGIVARLRGLVQLSCHGNGFTGSGLQQLAGLKELKDLTLDEEGISASDLGFVAGLPHMRHLRGLEEAGMDKAQLSTVRAMLLQVDVS